jgi:hypothetical protein
MEQRLNATYLRTGWLERAAGVGIICIGIGAAVLLVAWGVSFLWRYTPPEIAVRIANPEVHIAQTEPLTVTQDKAFTIAPPEPLRIDSRDLVTRVQQNAKPTSGNVITREVTVFSNVSHGAGFVTTGWIYKDGSGREPFRQYCYYYYAQPGLTGTNTRVDLASDGVRRPNIAAGLVPDLEGALAKCQCEQG